jgi:aspartate aminotransferase-like enzyme
LLEFHDNHVKGMTPSTPCISLFYGLQARLHQVDAEGLENRFERHRRLNQQVRAWGYGKGFSLLPEEQFATRGLNCFKNDRNADLERLNKTLKSRHKLVIDGGYGKLKGKTFRISNMGDESDATIATLIAALDDALAEQGM